MMAFNYESAALPVREDLKESYREFWNTLAQAGTWWDGPERVAIAFVSFANAGKKRSLLLMSLANIPPARFWDCQLLA